MPRGATSAIAQAHRRQVFAVRGRVLRFVQKYWQSLGSWRDGDVDRFIAAVVPMVAAGQRQISSLTDAYLAHVLSEMTGQVVPPVGIPSELLAAAALRNGVTPEQEFRRPFAAVWEALSQGKGLTDAVHAGSHRLASVVGTDLQLAKTHTARQVMANSPHVVGYRRVLEGPYSCGLCVVSSTQRYHKFELLPIHNLCDCSVMPIVGTQDPGRVLNRAILDGAHDAIQTTFGKSSRSADISAYRSKLRVTHNDEIGPVLSVVGHEAA